MTTPENAVLLAYSKIWLFDELLASSLPDDPWVESALVRYFPQALRERYSGYASPPAEARDHRHPRHQQHAQPGGRRTVHYIMEITGFSPAEIVRAYLLAREVVLAPLWKEIEALDNKVGDRVQAEMVIEADRLIVRATAWFLRSRRLTEDMAVVISHFSREWKRSRGNCPARSTTRTASGRNRSPRG